MSKKRRYSEVEKLASTSNQFDWSMCIFCQLATNAKLLCPAGIQREKYDPLVTYTNIVSNITRFLQLDCLPCPISITEDLSNASILLQNCAKYHKLCINKFSDLKLERVERKLNKNAHQSEEPSSSTALLQTSSSKQRINRGINIPRSSNTIIEKCFFCNKDSGQLRKVATFQVDRKVRQCAIALHDSELLSKLSCGDMIAQDALYHPTCLLGLYRKVNQLNLNSDNVEYTRENELHGIVLAELVSFIQQTVEEERTRVFKMTDLADLYRLRLIDMGETVPYRVHTTRLKTRLLSHIEDLREFKEGKETYLAFDDDLGGVMKEMYEQSFDDDGLVLSKAAEILRRDIFMKKSKTFTGEK